MTLNYGILFQVELSNYYYKDKISKGIDIVPTGTSRGILRNQGLIFQKTPSGLIVRYRIKKDHSGCKCPLIPIQQNTKFSFVLIPKDPLLYDYSDLNLDTGSNKIYHLHNLNNNFQNGELLLTSDKKSEFITKQDQIEVKPQRFKYNIQSLKPVAELSIIDNDGNKVLEPKMIDDSSCNIDLSDYPEDKYGITADREFKEYFYTSSLNRPSLGIIDIYNSDSVSSEYQYSDHNHIISSKIYKIKIAARSTFWRYNVVFRGDKAIHPDKLSVTTSDNSIEFTNLGLRSLSDGFTAVSFISNSEIPFRENSLIDFYLKEIGSSDADKIINLPVAAPNSYKLDLKENKPIFDSYVYL